MIHLVYASSATSLSVRDHLVDILRVSRENNRAAGVTGLLLYSGGTFFQVLEGPESAVEATFQRIARDPRHRGIEVLLREEKAARDFPAWQMGFFTAADLAAADRPDVSRYLQDGRLVGLGNDARRVRGLLRGFRAMASSDLG